MLNTNVNAGCHSGYGERLITGRISTDWLYVFSTNTVYVFRRQTTKSFRGITLNCHMKTEMIRTYFS